MKYNNKIDNLPERLATQIFQDIYFAGFTSKKCAKKYDCSPSVIENAKSTKVFKKLVKKFNEGWEKKVDFTIPKIINNIFQTIDTYITNVQAQKNPNFRDIETMIKIAERLHSKFAKKSEIVAHIDGDIIYEVSPEVQKLIEPNE